MKLGFGKIKDALKGGAEKNAGAEKKERIEEEIEPDRVEEVTMKTRTSEQKSEDESRNEPKNESEKKPENELKNEPGKIPEKEPMVPADRAGAKKTGLIFFPAFDWAISPTHPEREERLLYTRDQIFEEGLMDLPQIEEYKPRLADFRDIARVHFCVPDIKAQATTPHRISAGSCLVLADALMRGEVKNAFALVRPPGHHAMTVAHGNRGFCNINNEAILVEYLRKKYGIRRIAIVDTDVHHGDGTQEIFYNDPDVLFISFHQDGRTLYPGSGFMNELGGPRALGRTINIPLPPGTPDEGILYVLDALVLPILKDFRPELVLNSAGQDNHYTDPLANMRFSAQGYAKLNEKLAPDMAVLEGGYAIQSALPYVNTGIILAMAGLDYSCVKEPEFKPGMFVQAARDRKILEEVVATQLENWKNRDRLVEAEVAKHGDFYRRKKQIFYDTDMIQEFQEETVRMCPDCQGYVIIDSHAHRSINDTRIFGVSVPIYACASCQAEAREEYRKMLNYPEYEYVYLQDKKADEYRAYNTRTKQETVY
ncbi:histone deacetylase [Methanosarcina sp. 2.H.A.1B.4]|uniref:histone deacetylase family protein n=1 Tax=Methanosarcina sp. 2.H.A.1B.4 TaxID=1483600 RepID=UPI000621B596|nr:histone deacetylase [Methanosarcina sp. 2.H.A.1B.4]KKG11920.1 histone deacetylase [Methanosarcina sp. 2.H.A.1B.4]